MGVDLIFLGSSSRRVRGKNKNTAIASLGPGEKMPVEFNAHGRACGYNSITWAHDIGLVVRDPNVVPHTLLNWGDLSSVQLGHLWQAITVSITFSISVY